ncbi:MAG: electron transport complex subunit RsxC [Leptospiraceae bacterium]|nr:electron transport complex subunit RsxC [Leptospiraceae bacterium]
MLKTFEHGIHPPGHKHTAHSDIHRFPFAPLLILPLSQHIGAPARSIVQVGQEVRRGEPIAEPAAFVSVAMHAPVSGTIKHIGPAPGVRGMTPAISIEPFPASSQEVAWSRPRNVQNLTPEEIVDAVQQAGIVGMGGAAFPAHVKYKIPTGKFADTLLINGVECESFLTTDHRVMLEEALDILVGIRLVLRAIQCRRAVIGIENNKPDAIQILRTAIKGEAGAHALRMVPGDYDISVQALKVKYPQGAEKMLIKAVLNREVPEGGLPIDVRTVVSNVATVAAVGHLLPRGAGLIERVITITGNGIDHPGNYRIPIGTPLGTVMKHAGLKPDAGEIVLGGPMMGVAVDRLEIPVTKGASGIVVFTQAEVSAMNRTEYACIRCGHCVDVCPIFLNPARMGRLARNREYERMRDEMHLMSCFECGSCSYICPSNIPLVQYFRLAKNVLRGRSTP